MRRPWLVAVTLGAGFFAMAPETFAQCVMCAKNAEAAADASGGIGPLALAAAVLLVPTMLVLAAGVVVTWRMRRPASSTGDRALIRSGSTIGS